MISKEEAEKAGFSTVEGGSRLTADRAALRERLKELLPELVSSDGHLDVKALQEFLNLGLHDGSKKENITVIY